MNKTVFIGDIHGRTIWKRIVKKEGQECKYIFIGDYFDSFDIPGIDQIHNFKEICEFKRENKDNVILLIGNHIFDYFKKISYIILYYKYINNEIFF